MRDAITYRELRPDDHEAAARVVTLSEPNVPPLTVETVAWAISQADPERPRAMLVADRDGMLVGVAFLRGNPAFPGLILNLDVLSEVRRQGIGSRLLQLADEATGDHHLPVTTQVLETDTGSLAFTTHHGFVENDRVFESVVDLATFEPEAFGEARADAEARGIRFVSFSEVDSPELRHRLHPVCNEVVRDVPSTDRLVDLTYEQWVGTWLEAPHSRADLFTIALDGNAPVALSAITVMSDGTAYNHMTGVLRTHRGHGLGLAVKVDALARAKKAGIPTVRTDNHTRNAPMLAVNARLGYRRQPGWIEMVRRPEGASG